ncbi:glycoside hydrolase family 2 TIM barrel-domain containing protein [Maribellus maritimus]|uniref:glycoside hydrolase family 2 TIM barrel-domain containing protein n=1 Tax=Maribellus maritimus TaxID=2870838 RepID=UPI001EEA2055|nr:glycoside hydrolase family 2 TIM barrel-domain containing protein [Maribellus maritimus]MCG6187199.1 DUF4982 domain-containing protein [Maribellus maritimus]
MKLSYHCITAILILLVSCSKEENEINRETPFNCDWKFIRSDVQNGQAVSFNDSAWRILDLPHDYSIEDLPENEGVKQMGPFSEKSAGGASTGHVVGENAWYRKHFTLNKKDEGKIIKILFDGVYMNADFWINGKHLGNHPYGYTAFSYDLTDFLNPAGEDNVLAVQVKNEGKNSRWYSGSGIYRNVSLIKTNPVHIDLWGVYVTTPEVSKEKAFVNVETGITNTTHNAENYTIRTQILNPLGLISAEYEKGTDLNPGKNTVFQNKLEVQNPRLWSPEEPQLYTLTVQLFKGNKLIDETRQKFGIRTIEFSPEKGFLLNGNSVLLKGGCLHHDNGPLGSATFKTAEYRRIKIMKENGFNAIRTAHNPPSQTFLGACDEIGMLVMDEAFDQWQRPKNPEDYNLYFDDWWEKDLESMILRDRNHPSIIIWSIGNEINERADSSGLEIANNLKEKILLLDKTRPVTQAICHFWDQPGRDWEDTAPAFSQMDVHGYNYRWNDYESDHKKYPERIMIGTESFPLEALENWQMVEKHPYIIGDFVWTGMDYLGESGIGHTKLDNSDIQFLPPWPWFNAYCGDISILGYKKPQMYFRDVVWRNSNLEIMVHTPVPEGRKEIISKWGWPGEWKSWTWQGNEDKPLQVSVYSRCDQVRLELNGKEIGTKKVSEATSLTARFEVPYTEGELTAIGFKAGKEVVRQTLKTAEKPFAVKITPEQNTININKNDLAYFNIEVVDKNGIVVPNAEIPVDFEIQGNGKLQAVANGNPKDMKSFRQPHVKSFRGKCQLILRLEKDGGEISVSAKSEGLKTGNASVGVVKI